MRVRPEVFRAIFVIILAIVPFLADDYTSSALTEVFIFAIFAMSLDLLIGYTGLMSFGHAAFFGLGAYTVIGSVTRFGLDPWIGVALALPLTALAAAIIGYFCVRVSGIAFLMLTMAFAQLLYAGAMRWRGFTGGSDGMGGLGAPSLFGLSLSDPVVMYGVALTALVAGNWSLHRLVASPLGHTFVGIRENETRMRAIGYNVRFYKILAFAVAGTYGGFAGALYALYNGFVSPDVLNWGLSGDVLIMVMLGGVGTLDGPVIGAAIFLLIKNWVSSHTDHWLLVVGIIFIICVMFFRKGVWGSVSALGGRR